MSATRSAQANDQVLRKGTRKSRKSAHTHAVPTRVHAWAEKSQGKSTRDSRKSRWQYSRTTTRALAAANGEDDDGGGV